MQHLDIASVTGDQYAVLQFKGLYAGMQDTVWWRGQSGAGLRGQTCLVVTVPVVSGHWSGHTSRSVYNIHLYMLGLGVQVEILKALMVIIFASPPIFTPTLSIQAHI